MRIRPRSPRLVARPARSPAQIRFVLRVSVAVPGSGVIRGVVVLTEDLLRIVLPRDTDPLLATRHALPGQGAGECEAAVISCLRDRRFPRVPNDTPGAGLALPIAVEDQVEDHVSQPVVVRALETGDDAHQLAAAVQIELLRDLRFEARGKMWDHPQRSSRSRRRRTRTSRWSCVASTTRSGSSLRETRTVLFTCAGVTSGASARRTCSASSRSMPRWAARGAEANANRPVRQMRFRTMRRLVNLMVFPFR